MVMATAQGEIKKTPLSEFKEVRRNGKIAMNLDKGDQFVAAKLVHENDEVVMITSSGQAIRFPVNKLRSASRTSGGVRGIKLDKGGKVVSLEVVTAGHELFSISEKGFGKRTPFGEYRITNRGGSGIRNYQITPKTGPVVASRTVHSGMELIVISKDGIVIRTRMDQIRMTGRAAQGVSVINVAAGDSVASLATIEMGNGGPTAGGPKGGPDPDGDAEQGTLEGIEPAAEKKGRKPTPIRGRQPPTRAAAPAKKAARKPAQAAKKAPAKKSAPARPAAKKASLPPRRPAPKGPSRRGPKSARLKKR
jgi:DNA gyrase subunit A